MWACTTNKVVKGTFFGVGKVTGVESNWGKFHHDHTRGIDVCREGLIESS